jgi:hypothetical protein
VDVELRPLHAVEREAGLAVGGRQALGEAAVARLLGRFSDGETRTRTGDTTISVLTPNLSNWAESPGKQWVLDHGTSEAIARYLRSFVLQLGTQIGAGTQSYGGEQQRPQEAA